MSERLESADHERTTSPFWSFSLRIYRQAGVPDACLALQDGAGVDVNVLLFGLFCATRGRMLCAADMAAIVTFIEPWRSSVVVPLRGVRRFLREAPEGFEGREAPALRQRVKAAELEAERLQQEALFARWPLDALGSPAAAPTAARANIEAYGACLGAEFDSDAVEALLAAFVSIGDFQT